ncbi:hypothetical protein BO82DRAFT_407809 [Aspergillus uvarum CBS 121591]|uniref:Uncharacterized protein n=1 Tax=Aspergillus uvarum CBS 121591 TaxID=1448315 RepID=A0A319BTD2_9EURO|nr:hypothetical protein BO82DRAFT_407809 [Aspergillus uvarum CBS 121591]PYH75721.1 hypothetical protein BO82DRAFT_407809 [Aspergillus uvarum CBS 121591]
MPTQARAAVATARCGRRSTPLGGEVSPKATEARGPSGRRHRWGLWIIGRWPAFPSRFPGGAAVRYPLFASVLARSGPPTRGPLNAPHMTMILTADNQITGRLFALPYTARTLAEIQVCLPLTRITLETGHFLDEFGSSNTSY